MTNTTTDQASSRQPRPRRWPQALALLLAVVVIAALAWVWAPARRYAVTGAAYGARVACSCRYIGGRSLADCHKDLERQTAWASLSEDPATRSVTASYPLLASQTATFHDGWGCQLQPWTGSR
ncbi:hypothetical protein [Novosphingobium sp. FSW06-99]|uniref:hypothetical protein n=1 Tax=Novosphingobium sp. FSW06-99 TaxID=1739113 RepID=UPI000AA6FC94|nr:hypothetical protein [Novosphingobium sp. FSW06-99]